MIVKELKNEWGEKFFNGICPYTGKLCDKWTCYDCEVEKEERNSYNEESEEEE